MNKCIAFNPNEFMIYNPEVAVYFNTYRSTGQHGINRKTGEKLSDEDIAKYLEKCTEEQIEHSKELMPEDKEALTGIIKVHPEVRHKALAIDGYGDEKDKVNKDAEAPEDEKNKKKEDPKLPTLDKNKEQPKEGIWTKIVDQIRKSVLPGYSIEDQKKFRKEHEESLKKLAPLKQYLDKHAEYIDVVTELTKEGEFNDKSVELLTWMVKNDPEWLKNLNIDSVDVRNYSKDEVKRSKEVSNLVKNGVEAILAINKIDGLDAFYTEDNEKVINGFKSLLNEKEIPLHENSVVVIKDDHGELKNERRLIHFALEIQSFERFEKEFNIKSSEFQKVWRVGKGKEG